jgi:hypothetical protein
LFADISAAAKAKPPGIKEYFNLAAALQLVYL